MIKSVNYYTANFGIAKANNNPILIPLELELEIDGIGGIYPGNSFHSSYVPKKYQDTTVFQAFDINHKVGTEGWTVTISGKMRSSINTIMNPPERFGEIEFLIRKHENVSTIAENEKKYIYYKITSSNLG